MRRTSQFGPLLCAMVLALLSIAEVAHAQSGGSVVLTGRIGARLSLQAGNPEGPSSISGFGSRISADQVTFRFHVAGSSMPQEVTVPLLLRSNADYCLAADLAGQSSGVELDISDPSPNGDGARVMSAALSSFTHGGALSPCSNGIAGGGRISAGGTDQTPDNAIRTVLRVLVPGDSNSRDFMIELQMRARSEASGS